MNDLMSHVVNRIDMKGVDTDNKSIMRRNIIYLKYIHIHTQHIHTRYPDKGGCTKGCQAQEVSSERWHDTQVSSLRRYVCI